MSPPIVDEESGALVVLIAEGGERAHEAEAALCRRFGPRIRLYGMRHLRDADSARELVQIVLLGVLEAARAGRVREPEHVERFILGTCRNAAIRLRQKDNRARPTETEELARMLVTEEQPSAPEPLDVRALAGCLEKLETRARRVVTMAFREDRPADEIARAVGTTAGNVRVIRHRALAALRACLDGQRESA